MRELTDEARLRELLRELGRTRVAGRVYLTGGATAVLLGWRATTLDVDLKLEPEHDELFRAIRDLKDRLRVNVELATPSDFIPELPGWRDRSIFVTREGSLDVFHVDPYSQALSKIERGHSHDLRDVASMRASGLIEPERLGELFDAIEPSLFRYPAIDPAAFRQRVEAAIAGMHGG